MARARRTPSGLLVAIGLALAAGTATEVRSQAPATVFEGARLITGDGGVIDSSAFVVENNRFTAVGRRGEVAVPAGAARVDLSGKRATWNHPKNEP
jgi:imidazolonepropionase-like amidohydrolase